VKALITGIKSFLYRTKSMWGDENMRTFNGFPSISTKEDLLKATEFNGNTGNFLIGEGAALAIGLESGYYADFDYLYHRRNDRDYIQRIRSDFEVIVFATANLLRADYNAASEAEMFEIIGLPVIVLGIGCQTLSELESSIPAGTKRLVEYLARIDAQVFTRGEETAGYLRALGVRNVWPTGCPSLFLRTQNVIDAVKRLRDFEFSASGRIGFSGYLGKDTKTVDDIIQIGEGYDHHAYMLQDEHRSYNYEFLAEPNERIYNDFTGQIIGDVRFVDFERLPKLDHRLFFNNDQWRGFLSAFDFCFGRRFHGVVVGLQAGVPGVMLTIDDRMNEMLNQSGLPMITLDEWNSEPDKRKVITSMINKFNFDAFSEDYERKSVQFHERLKSLGLGT
jgi:hypothetical protein